MIHNALRFTAKLKSTSSNYEGTSYMNVWLKYVFINKKNNL
jgi:hypothetical protein